MALRQVQDTPIRLNRQHGVTIVMALDDLQQAAWFSHWLVVMQEGRVTGQGSPGEVLTSGLIAATFEGSGV